MLLTGVRPFVFLAHLAYFLMTAQFSDCAVIMMSQGLQFMVTLYFMHLVAAYTRQIANNSEKTILQQGRDKSYSTIV